MSDVDWVKERAACSPRNVFQRLREATKGDVDTRNAQRVDNDAYVFRFVGDDPDQFYVTREGRGLASQNVSFIRVEDSIHVESSGNADVTVKFQAKVGMTPEGACRLFIDKEPYEEWQIRKRALEALFFYVYRQWL